LLLTTTANTFTVVCHTSSASSLDPTIAWGRCRCAAPPPSRFCSWPGLVRPPPPELHPSVGAHNPKHALELLPCRLRAPHRRKLWAPMPSLLPNTVKGRGLKFEKGGGANYEAMSMWIVQGCVYRTTGWFGESTRASVQSSCPIWFILFLLCIILAEGLEIHSNSYKNHKIANEEFLESLWVDIFIRVITWHVLV
jgi:hypothetical protein